MKKLRFIIIALLLYGPCDAPARQTRIPGKEAAKQPSAEQTISDRMFVKLQGEDLYITAKLDPQNDIIYLFRRCMFNRLYTFYRVSSIPNSDPEPTTNPETAPQLLLNRAYSDNIGPFNIAGHGWCGANHKYLERTAPTACNEGFTIRVDNRELRGDTRMWARSVIVTSENTILDPTRPGTDPAGREELRDKLCHETATYHIFRNSIEVQVSHRFCNPTPVCVAIYYGMQSMFEGEKQVLTVDGACADWTDTGQVTHFTKQEYPHFRRYIERSGHSYQSTYLLPEGLGDHAQIDEDDYLFVYASYGKSYHKLIGNKERVDGDTTRWRGLYTWFAEALTDDATLLCYDGWLRDGHLLFIACKGACERSVEFPPYIDLNHFETVESSAGIQVVQAAKHALKIRATQAGGCILRLKR